MKKLINAITLVADCTIGALLIIGGAVVMIGGMTGTLWLA